MKAFIISGILLGLIYFSNGGPLRLQKRATFYIANETACVVDDTVYANGDPIPSDDPCESCRCRPPGFACVLKECRIKPGCRALRKEGECCPEYVCGCEHNGVMYQDGEEIRDSRNPCYICHCQGNAIACAFMECYFQSGCSPLYIEGQCCPSFENCGALDSVNNTFNDETIIQNEKSIYDLLTTTIVPFTPNLPLEDEKTSTEQTSDLKETVAPETPIPESVLSISTESNLLSTDMPVTPTESVKVEEASVESKSEINAETIEESSTETTKVPDVEKVDQPNEDLLKADTEIKTEVENDERSTSNNEKFETTTAVSESLTPALLPETSTDSDIDNLIEHEKRLRSLKNITSSAIIITEGEAEGNETPAEDIKVPSSNEDIKVLSSTEDTSVPSSTEDIKVPSATEDIKVSTSTENIKDSAITEETVSAPTENAKVPPSIETIVESVSDKIDLTTETSNEKELSENVESTTPVIEHKANALLYNDATENPKKEHVETVTYTFLVVDPEEKGSPKPNDIVISEISDAKDQKEPEPSIDEKLPKEDNTVLDSEITSGLESNASENKEVPESENDFRKEEASTTEITASEVSEKDETATETTTVPKIGKALNEEFETETTNVNTETSQGSTENNQTTTENITESSSKPTTLSESTPAENVDALTEFILKNNQPEDKTEETVNSTVDESSVNTKEL